jgi:hypothetical protein
MQLVNPGRSDPWRVVQSVHGADVGHSKNDVPSGCYSQSKSVREESRSSFKRAQTQRLRSECRVVSNTKWRDDGVAFDWVKKVRSSTFTLVALA